MMQRTKDSAHLRCIASYIQLTKDSKSKEYWVLKTSVLVKNPMLNFSHTFVFCGTLKKCRKWHILLNLATRGCPWVKFKFRHASTLGEGHLGQRWRIYMGIHNYSFKKKIHHCDTYDIIPLRKKSTIMTHMILLKWLNPIILNTMGSHLMVESHHKSFNIEEQYDDFIMCWVSIIL